MAPLRYALVVDDQQLIASLVSNLLAENGFRVEVCSDVISAQTTLKDFDPDIAIIDLNLGVGPSGIDLAHFIARTRPETAILILTDYPSLPSVKLGGVELPNNANFLEKSAISDVTKLLDAVESSIAGLPSEGRPSSGRLAALTRNQVSVLRSLTEGYSISEIANQRDLSTSAIEKTITRIYDRLGLEPSEPTNQRVEAIRIYINEAGLPERK